MVDQGTWVAIRHAYEAGGTSVASLATTFGVNASTVYSRIRREKWKRPAPSSGGAKRRSGKTARSGHSIQDGKRTEAWGKSRPGPPKSRTADMAVGSGGGVGRDLHRQLWGRLYNAIDRKLSRLERRMQSDAPVSAADSERETRELSSMVRSFEKVLEVSAELEGRDETPATGGVAGKAAGSTGAEDAAADAERLREEILARLARLHGERQPEDDPGGSVA